MHKPLLCRLFGHKIAGRWTAPDGRVTIYCQREKRNIVVFPGWESINRGTLS